MGKNLIIKGADFSENGLRNYSYLIGITDAEFNLCTLITNPGVTTPYMFTDKLSVFSSVVSGEKAIIGIRLKVNTAGIIPIYVADFSSDDGVMSNYQFKEDLNVPQDAVGNIVDIKFTTPIYLQANQKIVFGNRGAITMTAKWYFGYQNGHFENLCISTNSGSTWEVSSVPLSVDYLVQEWEV